MMGRTLKALLLMAGGVCAEHGGTPGIEARNRALREEVAGLVKNERLKVFWEEEAGAESGEMDLERVGSLGDRRGQSALAGLLTHGEFCKASPPRVGCPFQVHSRRSVPAVSGSN